ncbi:hypothetical protein SAMN06297129_3273 [Pseudooceanicola antarcticus]|uniref:GIY-YIG nuclease family protein n=1 Tax=Pseudooceanicola antarcticus TaxID=1247613 RepID=A0A285JAE1_9RHOB|nr:hypothetical protein [Pseudooceanicola antarcticus]PJE27073.1 hypothetical protein CVM39_17290 [Pseudooceanicola antarcticus]SNY56376.1 hypothetical protein SAMN06297129_3273 [Pseudooceanicola antarcticus]
MTDMIDFPLDTKADGTLAHAGTSLRFTLLDSLDQLPDHGGLYVLLGSDPEGLKPLAFGATHSLSRLTRGSDFAAALREGFYAVGIAPAPHGAGAQEIVRALGRRHRAPINTRQEALRAIEAAQLPAEVPLAAE